MSTGDAVRAVADAVLYEGYLLYPYRSTAPKNQCRFQFGVLGPPGAAASAYAERPDMSCQCVLRGPTHASVGIAVRFLQLQRRQVEEAAPGGFRPVDELTVGGRTWTTWDEAVACEQRVAALAFGDLTAGRTIGVAASGGVDTEEVRDARGAVRGRIVRTRQPLRAQLTVHARRAGELATVSFRLTNTGGTGDPASLDKRGALSVSLLGTHLIVTADDTDFVSVLDPPPDAAELVEACEQDRLFPVLAGPRGGTRALLVAPIILYDYPEVAAQSDGTLFDSTEIDEILTLRIMTMTDEEKQQARTTDPLAAELIDRCNGMTPETLLALHGVRREPRGIEHSMAPAAGPPAIPPESGEEPRP